MTKLTQTTFKMKLFNTEKEYDQALNRLNDIFDSTPESADGQEAELLALLIEEYEGQHHQIEAPDPITAIKIRMEELNLRQKDLVGVVGSKGIVSEVLNRKRRLTVRMIRDLSEKLKLSANVLIQEYNLKTEVK